MPGAPFKPPFGLSGINGSRSATFHLPRPPKKNDSVEGYRPPSPASDPRTGTAFANASSCLRQGQLGSVRSRDTYPTQAKGRLEWGTQHLLPVWEKLWRAHGTCSTDRPVLTQTQKLWAFLRLFAEALTTSPRKRLRKSPRRTASNRSVAIKPILFIVAYGPPKPTP